MAHSVDCPACAVTIRLSDDTFAKRISGRRVKITCKGCQEPFYIDATGAAPRASLLPPPGKRRSSAPPADSLHAPVPEIPRAAALPRLGSAPLPPAMRPLVPPPLPEAGPLLGRSAQKAPPPPPRPGQVKASLVPSVVPEMVESLVPSANAPALIEEELPTLPRQPRPFATAEAPAPFYEPPPTSRSVLPPLSTAPTPEVIAAMSKRRPTHRYAVAAAALVVLGAGTLAARPGVSTWVADLLKRQDTAETVVAKQDAAVDGAAAKRDEVVVTEVVQGATPEKVAALPALGEASAVEPVAAQPAHAAGPVAPVAAKAESAQRAAESSPAAAPVAVVADAANADKAPSSSSAADGHTVSKEALSEPTAEEAVVPGPFDKNAAVTALQVASAQASSCRKAGDPSGMARVVVTFAPSGRVTSATVSGAPFAGTQTGGCIASQFRSARVPAFEGALVTVTRSVVVQ